MGYAENSKDRQQSIVHLIIGILIFGSIWGFFEATLGGFLHLIIFPNKGAIMAGIGVAVMASALALYKRPSILPGIGIVAALFKLLDVWLFALPITSIHIINPATAIIAPMINTHMAANISNIVSILLMISLLLRYRNLKVPTACNCFTVVGLDNDAGCMDWFISGFHFINCRCQ